MRHKLGRTLAVALAAFLTVPWTAFADNLVLNSVSLDDTGGVISVQLQATDGSPGNPDRNGCNASASNPVTVMVTSSDPAQIPHPGSLTFTTCNTQQISFTILPSAAGGTVVLSTTTSGGQPSSKFSEGAVSVVLASRDTVPPVISVPGDMTLEAASAAGAEATFVVTAHDAVDGAVDVACSAASGDTFGLGSTTVTCSAVDAAGNEATASFTITVVDTTAPVLTLPPDFTVEANTSGGAVVEFVAAAMDNVDGAVEVNCSTASGGMFHLGSTTVTCSAGDAAGNDVSGSFEVTVVDTTAPVVTIGGVTNGSLYYGSAPISVFAEDIADPNPVTGYDVVNNGDGTFTVTAWATDGSGNTGYAAPVTYSVWGFGASGMPNRPKVKHGSTVPLRYTLNLPAGMDPNAMTFRGCVSLVLAGEAAPVDGALENLSTNADHGCTFRYDDKAGQYVFNLSTRSLSVGMAYDIYVVFGSGQVEKLGMIDIQR